MFYGVLPHTIVKRVIVEVVTAFTGPGLSAATVRIGDKSIADGYIKGSDITKTKNYGLIASDRGTFFSSGDDLSHWGIATMVLH
jgi:hypothetical protein